jgi:predicted DNA-binding transcriptional regulator AlpA
MNSHEYIYRITSEPWIHQSNDVRAKNTSIEWCQSQEYIYRMMSESRIHLPNDVRVKEYIYRMMSEPGIHLPNDVRVVFLALTSFDWCILGSDIIRLMYSWLWCNSVDVFLALTSFGRCIRAKNTSTEWCQCQEYIYRMNSEPRMHLPNDVRVKNTSTKWCQIDIFLALIPFGRCIFGSDIIR